MHPQKVNQVQYHKVLPQNAVMAATVSANITEGHAHIMVV
jgi:hypothetical protein